MVFTDEAKESNDKTVRIRGYFVLSQAAVAEALFECVHAAAAAAAAAAACYAVLLLPLAPLPKEPSKTSNKQEFTCTKLICFL